MLSFVQAGEPPAASTAACVEETCSELCMNPAYPALQQRYNRRQLFFLHMTSVGSLWHSSGNLSWVLAGKARGETPVPKVVAEQGEGVAQAGELFYR